MGGDGGGGDWCCCCGVDAAGKLEVLRTPLDSRGSLDQGCLHDDDDEDIAYLKVREERRKEERERGRCHRGEGRERISTSRGGFLNWWAVIMATQLRNE